MRVAVVGAGYVGLVTGVCLADMGYDVVCIDRDIGKVQQLQRGDIPIYEPGLKQLLDRNQHDQRILFSSSIQDHIQNIKVCFICVGTPPNSEGGADKT